MGGRAKSGRVSRNGVPAQRRGRSGPARRLRVPEARDIYTAAITDSAELMAAVDALDAEVWVASNVSAMRVDVPRQQVIRQLADVWQRCDAADPARYAAALESVGRQGRRQEGR